MLKKRLLMWITAIVIVVAACMLIGCSESVKATKNKITVTLSNGAHYSVIGENKKVPDETAAASFDIRLDEGYKIVGEYGDDVVVTDDLSFTQTVTFTNVRYKTVVWLETEKIDECEFTVKTENDELGSIEIETAFGEIAENKYYAGDKMDITVTPESDYVFLCWSTNNYINDGGEFYSYKYKLDGFDFETIDTLYANFKSKSDMGNMIIYRMENGHEYSQDCTVLLQHHARANTFTAAEIEERGVDCTSRLLAGWQTEDGEWIGLGSRATVTSDKPTVLYPMWKEYSSEKDFTVTEDGVLTKYIGNDSDIEEIVVPSEVNGIQVTTIGANAFESCGATSYYMPSTVETVENNAFLNCTSLIDFYMSDNIMSIDDKAFTGCKNFISLHLNAVLKPRYNNSTSVKLEVYDRLIANADNEVQKLVLLADSNVRYGYSSKVINELFEESGLNVPEIYNLAVAADMGLYCQYEMCKPYLHEGDIFLHAPAEREGSWFGYYGTSPITGEECLQVNYRIFNVAECNWKLLSHITVNMYTNIFSQFKAFNKARATMEELRYTDYFHFVGDDEVGIRESTEAAYEEYGTDKNFNSNGNIKLSNNREKHIVDIRESMYKYFNTKRIRLFVTFGSINRQNLLVSYKDEETLKTVADNYTEYIKSLLSSVDCKILLTQYDTIYDGRHFSDSDLHLGEPFRNEHTEKVISALIESLRQEIDGGGGYSK